jgi:hypothetical protein
MDLPAEQIRSGVVTSAKQLEQKANVEAGNLSCKSMGKLCILNDQSTCERSHPCFLKIKANIFPIPFLEYDGQ